MNNDRTVWDRQTSPKLRTDERLSQLACKELVRRIETKAEANQVEHLIKPRILDVLSIRSLETALLHELKAVESMLLALCLYR